MLADGSMDVIEKEIHRLRCIIFDRQLTDYIFQKDREMYLQINRDLHSVTDRMVPFLRELGHPVPPADQHLMYKWP